MWNVLYADWVCSFSIKVLLDIDDDDDDNGCALVNARWAMARTTITNMKVIKLVPSFDQRCHIWNANITLRTVAAHECYCYINISSENGRRKRCNESNSESIHSATFACIHTILISFLVHWNGAQQCCSWMVLNGCFHLSAE